MPTVRDATTAASRARVAIGGAAWRAGAVQQATAEVGGGVRVIELPVPERPWPPWQGLADHVAALSDAAVALTPSHAAALDAAATGRFLGDHLGAGEDLRGLFAATALDGPVLLLVPEAHRLDLATAAALSFACADLSGLDMSVLVTQAPSTRGVTGLDTVIERAGAGVCPNVHDGLVGLPDPVERLSEARRRRSELDAAEALEDLGDWSAAAERWLLGGRPDRARRALGLAPAGNGATDTRARLLLATESSRIGIDAVTSSVADLVDAPVRAARLRMLLVPGLLNRGELDAVDDLLDAARRDLRTSERSAATTAALDLVTVAEASTDLTRGADPEPTLDACERPLGRVCEGANDRDAIALLSMAAMSLAWRGHLAEARSLLDRVTTPLEARRALVPLSFPLATSAWLARRRAQLDRALADGSRALEIARATGAVNDARFALVEVAHVEGTQGRLESCRRHVRELIPRHATPRGPAQIGAVSALAVAELQAGHHDRAIEALEPVQEQFAATVGPAQAGWRHILIEAYVCAGRRRDAETVLANLESWVGDDAAPRERGQLERCRGLLAPTGAYDAHFQQAGELLRSYPALRWRATLGYVRRLLEDGRRAEAESLGADLLGQAQSVGSSGGADQLRRLLSSHGIAVTPRVPAVSDLSVDHLRIALLAAEGADDDTIAEALRMSRPAVATSRQRILSVLGLRRTQDLSSRLDVVGGAAAAEGCRPDAVVSILGPLAVARDGERSMPPAGHPSTVLAYVALHTTVHIEQLVDVLWPDATVEQGRRRLRNVLARLRAVVGDVVVRRDQQLLLAGGVEVDAHRFEDLARRALGATGPGQLALIDDALAAWTGPPLADWPYDDWALRAAEQLSATRHALLARRAQFAV